MYNQKNIQIKIGDWGGHIPPQAPESEAAVLGAAMLESQCLETLFEVIQTTEAFYNPFNQKTFSAIQALYHSGSAVDIITVVDRMRKDGTLDAPGQENGAYLVTTLTSSVLSSAHVEAHARIVMEKFIKREQIRIGAVMVKNGFDDTVDVFDALNEAEVKIFELATNTIQKKGKPINHGVTDIIKRILDLRESKIEFSGTNTGFRTLNDITGGWQKSDLIILAARPSVGKTASIVNMVLNSAMDQLNGGPVGLFSLEMGLIEILQRMLASLSGVPFNHIKKPWLLSKEELAQLQTAAMVLAKLPIHIDDTAGLTLPQMRTKARLFVNKFGCKSLYLDYIQLMEGDSDSKGNREQEVSKISRGCKKLAKELEVPIIALSQLNRGPEIQKRPPDLSDLRESGALEQDADLVMFLYRPTKDEVDKKPNVQGKVLGVIAKHRNGATGGCIVFNARNDIQRWTEYDPAEFKVVSSQHFQQVKETENEVPYSFQANGTNGPAVQDDLPF